MPVILEEGDTTSLVRLEGDVDIASAAEIKSILINALASKKAIVLSLENVTELDITALQLLYAAELDSANSGIQFMLQGAFPEIVSAAMTDSGLTKFHFQQ